MKRLLIGILCIDRDHMHIPKLYHSLPKETDILVITRKTDKKTIKKFTKYNNSRLTILQVHKYAIVGRHNVVEIAKKRTIVMNYAERKGYDNLLFVDSDITLYPSLISDMEKLRQIDPRTIVCGIYNIKWLQNQPMILCIDGTLKSFKDVKVMDRVLVGGFGCCLIPKTAFSIPMEIVSLKLKNSTLTGEDFGWFLNANKQGFTVKPLLTRVIDHHIRD